MQKSEALRTHWDRRCHHPLAPHMVPVRIRAPPIVICSFIQHTFSLVEGPRVFWLRRSPTEVCTDATDIRSPEEEEARGGIGFLTLDRLGISASRV